MLVGSNSWLRTTQKRWHSNQNTKRCWTLEQKKGGNARIGDHLGGKWVHKKINKQKYFNLKLEFEKMRNLHSSEY